MLGTLLPRARSLRDGFSTEGVADYATSSGSRLYDGFDDMGWDLASLDPLRRAVAIVGGPARLSDRALRVALRPMCLEGHRAGKHAEEMVVLLKTVWPTIARSATTSSRRNDTDFERVVTIGIEEYYRPMPQAPK
jgi:hypothetical protein